MDPKLLNPKFELLLGFRPLNFEDASKKLFKDFLEKCKTSKISGGRFLQIFGLEGTRPPSPLRFDAHAWCCHQKVVGAVLSHLRLGASHPHCPTVPMSM